MKAKGRVFEMKRIASYFAGSAIAGIVMVGCTVNQPPDVVETPGHTTVIHEHTSSPPSINITPPSSSHTETNTTTTVPSPDAPDGSSTTQTTTTHSSTG
jgi:hypothetical protein